MLEVAVSNGLGRARRRIFPAGAILVYKTCRPIRAICAVHPHRRDVRAGSLEFRSASTLVWLAAEVIWVQEARRDRRLDAAWMEGVAACPRMKRGNFQPGSWRADGFLRCVVWGTYRHYGGLYRQTMFSVICARSKRLKGVEKGQAGSAWC